MVNKDRLFQDELGVDYFMIDVTNNTSPKPFELEIMPHIWLLDGWWKLYLLITFAWAFHQFWASWLKKLDVDDD